MLSQSGQSTRKSSLLPTSELLNQIVSLEGLQHYCAVKEPADKVMARILLGDQDQDVECWINSSLLQIVA